MKRRPKTQCFQGVIAFAVRLLPHLLIGCALLCVPGQAAAQDPYGCIDSLSDDEVSYRIRSIEESFDRGRHKALGWRIGWIGGFTALTAASAAMAVEAHSDGRPWDRFAFAYQGAATAAIVLGLAVVPMLDIRGGKRIRKQAANTPEERRHKLLYATRLLERGAGLQGFLASEGLVVASVAVGVTGGTIKAAKWTGKTRGNTALLYILPPVIATGTVLTAPRNLREDWEGYRQIACSGQYYDRGSQGPDLDWSISPTGVRFKVNF